MWYSLAFQITEYGVQVAGGGERLCGGQVALHPWPAPFCATHRFIPRFLVLTQSGNMMEKT